MKRSRSLIAKLVAVGLLSLSPSLSASADAGLTSDDFNLAGGLLGDEWTIVDSLGDGSFQITGVGTSDAQLLMGVPAGVAHTIWSSGVTAPIVMQDATDDDFEVEVKYDAEPTESSQSQGIIVQGAGGELLRFDFYSNKGRLRILSALIDGASASTFVNSKISSGTGELYMRVNRTGDTFTQSYSYNGTDWATATIFDAPIVLTGVGLQAGNGGALPAHTAVIDYFFVTSAPIVPEDGSISGPPFSDDFNRQCGVLNVGWSVIDPLGDSTVDVIGIGTSDAQLRISVPAGVEHNAWIDGLTIPRVVQAMNAADFEVEVRFESLLTGGIQGHGIILEDAAGDFVRFDFYSSGGQVRIFAANMANNVPTTHFNGPVPTTYSEYMRIGRVGDLWTQEYSNDGINWLPAATFSLAFTPIQIGVFALNSGANPAYAAVVDYFFKTSDPISPEDGSIVGEQIPRTLILDADVGGSATAVPDQPTYTCGDPVTLTATPDAGHVFGSWTGDIVSTQNPLVVPMSNDVSITATFVLDADPVINNLSVAVGDDFAIVSWTTDVPSTSVVNYGPSAAYENGEVSDLVFETDHSILLTGLNSETLYHFEASSTSAIGNSGLTGDQTFTTGAAGSDPSGVVSDDFNTECSILGDEWTVVDPLGDSTVSLVGLGTDDAQLLITVPAGVEHNLSTSNTNSPRVMQAINDGDFEVEVKFDSPLTVGTQAQGILIQQSATEFVRFGIYFNGKKLKAYAGTFSGNTLTTKANTRISLTAPYYIRATRSGDFWTQSVSDDGISWIVTGAFSHVIAATEAGVYALNSRTLPAHTAAVDYFFSTNSPLVPEDGPAPDGTDKTLEVFVSGSGSASQDPDEQTYTCGESVALSAIADLGSVFTGWTGDVTSTDNPLFLSVTSNTALSANFLLDTDPPVISGLATSAGGTTALVTWTTNEPATSVVDYGPTTAYEDGTVSDPGTVTAHGVLLTGLAPESTYHHLVTTVDANGLSTSTADLTFTTSVDRGPSGISSDDFNNNNLDTELWTLTDPLADSAIEISGPGTADALLLLDIPEGDNHSVTATSATAPRLLQTTADSDLRIDVKLEQGLTAAYQAQGIWIEAGPDEFVTFDRHTVGLTDRIAATTYSGGVATVEIDVPVPMLSTLHLRVERLGDGWVLSYSSDGSSFIPVGSFTHVMTVAASGIFAATASAGGDAPAFTSAFDFYFDADAPISPEDGATSADTLPPLIQAMTPLVNITSVEIRWTTDEPATSEVSYGPTAAYELGSVFDATPVYDHSVVLVGLDPETTYHFKVISEDALSQSAESGDSEFTTIYLGFTGGPIIDVWYSGYQRFGHVGLMQSWINILGNVSDSDGVVSLEYTLNGGAPRPLTQGPDTRRLADPGDFNCDIDAGELLQGVNTVSITAVDGEGNVSNRDVTVDFDGETIPPLPITIDWSTVSTLQDVAQPIDGLWAIEGDSVRSLQVDYDRLLGVGDVSYTDYEMTVPITIHAIDSGGFQSPSNGPGVGIILRWPGHSLSGSSQPAHGFLPLGAIGFLRYKQNGVTRMNIVANTGTQGTKYIVPFGVTYMYKMRVETVPGLGGSYSVKLWEQGTPEPPTWLLTRQETLADPQEGAPVLVSHHVDASFGTVVITEIP